MRKVILSLAVIGLLAGCATSNRSSTDSSYASPAVSETSEAPMTSESASPSASASATSTGTPANGGIVVGSATVTGELGSEPTVVIDTAAAPASELLIKDVATGKGKVVAPGATVTAHYVGYGAMSGQMFDSSWSRGEPATFPLDGVILGWQEGLLGMKEGGRRILVIPASQGYGDTPPEGSGIAPGETLVFVVDLTTVQ